MNKHIFFLISVYLLIFSHPTIAVERDYHFDGYISREVLCNYLGRSTTFAELLNPIHVEKNLNGSNDENLRLIRDLGIKFAGRTLYMWGGESRLDSLLANGKTMAEKVHQVDPDVILQAAIFEIVTTEVNEIAIPDWVFEEFEISPESRNFSYEAMLYPDGLFVNHWRQGHSVPDMSQLETRMWFFYLAASYINIGVEAIHFGQVALMDARDPDHQYWLDMMTHIRNFANKNARRHFVLCDAHVPTGGVVLPDGKLLFDFHSFPLRIKAVAEKPQQGMLQVGFIDSLYQRSKGGITPSGWECDSLPYIVEFDNWGRSNFEGENRDDYWCWGYDEIGWFAHQDEYYRDLWLHYAWNWVRHHDPNGYVQMPISRVLHSPVDDRDWYWAHKPSDEVPGGFNHEVAIKDIWENDVETISNEVKASQ